MVESVWAEYVSVRLPYTAVDVVPVDVSVFIRDAIDTEDVRASVDRAS